MSSTNKTTNLELSQFIGSDSPKWLTDYNADMEKIDTGYQTVKAQADATDLVVSGHTSSISTLQSTTTDQGTAITQLRTDVTGNTGSINTINSLIGNGEPTTTDKTLIGAINELNSDLTKIVPLTRLKTSGSVTATSEPNGVLTNSQLGKEAADNLLAIATNAANAGCKLFITGLILTGIGAFSFPRIPITCASDLTSFYLDGDATAVGATAYDLFKYSLGANNAVSIRQVEILVADSSITATDIGNAVATRKPIIYYEIYETVE